MMIRLLTGTIASSTGNQIIIDTTSGVGYLVTVVRRFTGLPGEPVRLFTHLAVRETALDLYGFSDEADLTMFELLLTISGIGPKSAMQIMDQADRTLLLESLSLRDATHLTKLSGISKKTAEKIIMTLADKIGDTIFPSTTLAPTSSAYQDAFDTLITLGYNPTSIRTVLEKLPAGETTSILVKLALRELS
jgi:holliday junction DNA helicase RuvA